VSSWALCTLVSASNTKLEKHLQTKQKVEFGCRFEVLRDVAVMGHLAGNSPQKSANLAHASVFQECQNMPAEYSGRRGNH
jgi:hypothetical protein